MLKKYIDRFKGKNSKIKLYLLCLENSLKDFAANNMKKAELNGHVSDFSFDYYVIDNSKIINIYKNLMWKTRYKIMFGFIKSIFMRLLSSTVNASKYK